MMTSREDKKKKRKFAWNLIHLIFFFCSSISEGPTIEMEIFPLGIEANPIVSRALLFWCLGTSCMYVCTVKVGTQPSNTVFVHVASKGTTFCLRHAAGVSLMVAGGTTLYYVSRGVDPSFCCRWQWWLPYPVSHTVATAGGNDAKLVLTFCFWGIMPERPLPRIGIICSGFGTMCKRRGFLPTDCDTTRRVCVEWISIWNKRGSHH